MLAGSWEFHLVLMSAVFEEEVPHVEVTIDGGPGKRIKNTLLAWRHEAAERVRATTPKLPLAAAQSPEQISVRIGRRGDDTSVCKDDGGRDQVVAGRSVSSQSAILRRRPPQRKPPMPTLPQPPRIGARQVALVASATSRVIAPGCTPTTARVMRIAFVRERSITSPSTQTKSPAKLWPPQRTETRSRSARANWTARWTPATSGHCAISAG
jgi:hypothetical protein